MKPVRKQRLMLLIFIALGVAVAVGLVLMALQQNINLYYSPAQMQAGEAPVNHRIRAGGLVVNGSLKRDSKNLEIQFKVTDGQGTVTVLYDGILPDLFRESQGIVATGQLNENGDFIAEEILAKHDENYTPPEVQEAIDRAHPDGLGLKKGRNKAAEEALQ